MRGPFGPLSCTYLHAYARACTRTCVFVCVRICVCVTYVCACVDGCVPTCVHLLCTCACVCVCARAYVVRACACEGIEDALPLGVLPPQERASLLSCLSTLGALRGSLGGFPGLSCSCLNLFI